MPLPLTTLTQRDEALLTDPVYAEAVTERVTRLHEAIVLTPPYIGQTREYVRTRSRDELYAVLDLIETSDLYDDDAVIDQVCQLIADGLDPMHAAGVICTGTPANPMFLED